MSNQAATFSESWYRVANQRLSLRPSVRVRRQYFRGQRWHVLEDPFSNRFFRLQPPAYEFVARLRPDRTVEEVWKECLQRFPDEAPGQESVIQLLGQLYRAGLLQYDFAEDTAQLFDRFEKTRQREFRARFLNVMFMRFPLLDPDRFLVRTLPLLRKLISPFGAVIWLATIAAALKIGIDNFAALRDQSQGILAPGNLVLLYAGLVFIKTCHEFGHAYFCRRFGGEVHVLGVMLMIFTPIPYMDATSSWGFRRRGQRILVAAAGMIAELFIAALATFVWVNTGPGMLHSLAYNMMLVASVSTLIFNLNPLLRFDGYYILSDLLGIPNLHQRALQQLKHGVERYVFGVKASESPARTRTEAGWLGIFGVASGLYRMVVFGSILLLTADRYLLLGVLMAVFCCVSWVLVPAGKLIQYLASSPRLSRCRGRALLSVVGVVASLFLLLSWIPVPNHFRAPGVLQAREWSGVVNESSGILELLLAVPGSHVVQGQPLMQLANRELELDLTATLAKRDEIEARLRQALRESTPDLKPLRTLMDSVTARLGRLESDKAALVVRARQNGIWVAPDAQDSIGRWTTRGTEIGIVIDPSSFEFLAPVAQVDGDALFGRRLLGAEVRLFGQGDARVPIDRWTVIPAERRRLPSAALGWAAAGEIPVSASDPKGVTSREPFFEVRGEVNVAAADAALLHGRSGKIRFDLAPEPLLPRWIRRIRQLVQQRYQA
jgi:putative peptide zinc metalloprotease protein